MKQNIARPEEEEKVLGEEGMGLLAQIKNMRKKDGIEEGFDE